LQATVQASQDREHALQQQLAENEACVQQKQQQLAELLASVTDLQAQLSE
jgi:hypothetical protein